MKLKSDSSTVAEYLYDALGRRVEKEVGGDVWRFIYSDLETVAVYDGSNSWLQDFVFGQRIDEVLMLEQADVLDFDGDSNTTETTRSFYHLNALGSVTEITEMDEDVAASYRYDPYGAVTIIRNSTEESEDPLGQPWMFTGRFADEETGMYYYRSRAYDPEVGRFTQRDGLSYASGPNLYEYVGSHPPSGRDPLGLEEEDTDEKSAEDKPDQGPDTEKLMKPRWRPPGRAGWTAAFTKAHLEWWEVIIREYELHGHPAERRRPAPAKPEKTAFDKDGTSPPPWMVIPHVPAGGGGTTVCPGSGPKSLRDWLGDKDLPPWLVAPHLLDEPLDGESNADGSDDAGSDGAGKGETEGDKKTGESGKPAK